MKRAALIILCFGTGLGLSRFTPRAATSSPALSPPPDDAIREASVPTPSTPAPGYSLEGDWRLSVKDWAAKDPVAFHQWLLERGTRPSPQVLQVLFGEWARHDAEAAFSAALNLPVDFKREDNLLDEMLAQVLKQPGGLETALKWIPSVVEQIDGWVHPGTEWMKTRPPEQIAALLAAGSSGSGYSGTLISMFSSYWAAHDHEAALTWMNTLNPKQRNNAAEGLMNTWSKTNPRAAMDYLASDQATTEDRFHALEPMAELSKTDPKAALEWWEDNIGVTNYESLQTVYRVWGKEAPAEALDYARAIEDPVLRRDSLQAWGSSVEGAEVLQTIIRQPPGPDRQALLDSLPGNYSKGAVPAAEIRNFVADPTNTDISTTMAEMVSSIYANSEPQAALEWAASLPESRRDRSIHAVIKNWKDKIAAAQAAGNLPPGPIREAALQALAIP